MSAGADISTCARPIDAQPLHQGLQRGAFQAESRGGARGTAHHPLGLLRAPCAAGTVPPRSRRAPKVPGSACGPQLLPPRSRVGSSLPIKGCFALVMTRR
jgi:hypothetical protein